MTRAATRREALAVVGAGGLAFASALALGGCTSSTPADQISEANRSLIAELDIQAVRLPTGSVVEATFGGRWMIVGHKVLAVADETQNCYDYYACAWPGGIKYAKHEEVDCAVLNRDNISKVCFIGYNDEEDRDFRAYIEAYDIAAYSEVSFDGAPGVMVSTANTAMEQGLRAQGKLSAELYGEHFDGGLLYSGKAPAAASE